MKPEEIHLTDLHRILFGEVPGSFYIELLIRTVVIYAILMISMRLMGKRMSAQLGRNEMAALVSLAAAIGVPLQAPDRGLVPAVIIAFVIIFFQIVISKYATINQHFEQLTQDEFAILVENSRMKLDKMVTTRISRERLFAQLRLSGISHLGMVKRLYLEANGSFTLIKNIETQPGLDIIPEKDQEFSIRIHQPTAQLTCYSCGNMQTKDLQKGSECSYCRNDKWVPAVTVMT
jgi:uncharacterized membrane protein YcaP (DUF421 family)